MSYSDYMAGFQDGMTTGFGMGRRYGYDLGEVSGYKRGYKDGYGDAKHELPYNPKPPMLLPDKELYDLQPPQERMTFDSPRSRQELLPLQERRSWDKF